MYIMVLYMFFCEQFFELIRKCEVSYKVLMNYEVAS